MTSEVALSKKIEKFRSSIFPAWIYKNNLRPEICLLKNNKRRNWVKAVDALSDLMYKRVLIWVLSSTRALT